MHSFAELSVERFRDSIVILDVDGTLMRDQGEAIAEDAARKIRELSAVADVYLCSNAHDDRARAIARELDISFLNTPHKKPSRRVLETLHAHEKQVYVIGDKSLTDGIFALNIGAQFVEVRRMRDTVDRFSMRVLYIVDDIAGFFLRPIFPALPYLVLMRPMQWIKNTLVFAPFFFAGSFTEPVLLAKTLLAVIIFCATSSAMYVFNDILDREQDALHPSKRGRPLASGMITVRGSSVLLACLLAGASAGLFVLPSIAPAILGYLVLNAAYSLFLKHIPIVDIVSVSFSYVLRLIAGGAATATYVSSWILLCVFFGALLIIIQKRRAEYMHASRRKVLQQYSRGVLDVLLIISAMLAIVSYGLYSVLGNPSPYALYSSVFVAAGISRFLSITHRSADAEYPETLLFKDRWIFLSLLLWANYMFILFYVI